MENNGYAIIFDTNSYREFVLNKNKDEIENDLQKLLNCESNMNIDCYASSIVQMELLKHFDDDNELNSFRNCVDAALFMNRHCQIQNTTSTRIFPPFYFQICKTFFQKAYKEEYFLKLSQCVNDFYLNFHTAFEHHIRNNTFLDILNNVDKMKKDFIYGIGTVLNTFEGIVEEKNPTINKKQKKSRVLQLISGERFEYEFSTQIIEKIILDLNLDINQEGIKYYAENLKVHFPLIIKFYRYILTKIIEDNIDLHSNRSKKTRWNWFMDYQILASVNHHTIQNKNMIIITKDKDIKNVLSNDEVMDIDEYLKFVKFN